MVKTDKSVFYHEVYDSDIEPNFASTFEKNEDTKTHCKLPGWLNIYTYLGA
ncbi:restriction endonuclease [Pantoea dispersa]